MKYIFFAAFLAVSAVHLYGSYKKDAKIRAKTKGFIVLALAGFYFFSADKPEPITVAALLASCLGDVLLIKKGVRWFAAGGVSFAISHIFFILSYYPYIVFEKLSVPFIAATSLAYFIASVVIFRALSTRIPKKLFVPMLGYLLVNGAMNMFALMQFLTKACLASGIALAGAVLFFISDALLFFLHFHKANEIQKSHFKVMLTYIAAEFLITEGLILMQNS